MLKIITAVCPFTSSRDIKSRKIGTESARLAVVSITCFKDHVFTAKIFCKWYRFIGLIDTDVKLVYNSYFYEKVSTRLNNSQKPTHKH